MDKSLERVELLIGSEALNTLQNKKVLVIGVGGVGGICAESLARSGVGKLRVVDKDIVDISNLNRQIQTKYSNVSNSKVLEIKKRIEEFSNCEVEALEMFYDKDKNYIFDGVDFVVDAIDSINSKADIIEYCLKNKVCFISSMGMAFRLDPSKVKIVDLFDTYNDPLSRNLRTIIRKRGIKGKIPVAFSDELVYRIKESYPHPASMMFVPSVSGLLCASYVVRKLAGINH